MNHFKQLTSLSLEELAKWINNNVQHEGSPWMTWFDKKYCSKCEPEIVKKEDFMSKLGFEFLYKKEIECSYCEVYNKCRFFPNKKNPSTVEIIELWLKEEVK